MSLMRKPLLLTVSLITVLSALLAAVWGLNSMAAQYFPEQLLSSPPGGAWSSSLKTSEEKNKYVYHYLFRDHRNRAGLWTWKMDKHAVQQTSSRYGLPPDFLSRFKVTRETIESRKYQIQEGMFTYNEGHLTPDIETIANYYLPLMRPLYLLLASVADQESLNKRDRLKLMMRFCQDIPYAAPPTIYKGRYIAGLFPPPLLLNNGWGDCDSKSVLLLSVMLHDPSYEFIFIRSRGHAFLGVKDIPRPYEKSIKYKGNDYVLCEPVGPRRTDPGFIQDDYAQIKSITAVPPWPEVLARARQKDQGAEFNFQKMEKSVEIVLAEEERVINNKTFELFRNSRGFDETFYKLSNMPDEKGSYLINSEEKSLYLMLQRPGYYLHKSITDLSGHDDKIIVFNFSPERCLYINTQPHRNVYIFKKGRNGYNGMQYQADARGKIRVICDAGLYDVSGTSSLSGKPLNLDYSKGIGATVSIP